VLQVLTTELENEEDENVALKEQEDVYKNALSSLQGKLEVLKSNIR